MLKLQFLLFTLRMKKKNYKNSALYYYLYSKGLNDTFFSVHFLLLTFIYKIKVKNPHDKSELEDILTKKS